MERAPPRTDGPASDPSFLPSTPSTNWRVGMSVFCNNEMGEYSTGGHVCNNEMGEYCTGGHLCNNEMDEYCTGDHICSNEMGEYSTGDRLYCVCRSILCL